MLGAEYASTTCQLIHDCYGDVAAQIFAGGTLTECETRLTASFDNGTLPRYQAALAMNTMTYDASQAGACLDAVQVLGCAVGTQRSPAACDALFVGHVAAGGACAIDEECVGDSFCSVTTACPGTCQARSGSGAACTRDEGCQSGLKCTSSACAAPGGMGAACQGTTHVECGGGLSCVGGSTTATGICNTTASVFSIASGQPCNLAMSQLCQSGLSCTATSLTVQECVAGGLTAGTACHAAVPDQCGAGLYCNDLAVGMGDIDGTCATLPTDGQPCATGGFLTSPCVNGLSCHDGTCHTINANGGSCMTGDDCFSGLCNGTTCAAPPYCPGT